jgi:hypothetical protein
MKNINEAFTPEESKKVYDNFLAIVNDEKRRKKLVDKHGSNAEAVAYGRAVNQIKKQSSEEKPEEKMDKTEKLKEMVKDALMNPKKADLNKDGKLSDYEKKRGAAIEKAMQKEDETAEKGIIDEPISEDLDIGHTDNEPHMLKADLYRIGKYAMELYKMMCKFDKMDNEVDFPHWWQSKIVKAKEMLISAKHYLDFEIKEPQIDAMVNVASEEEVIDEKLKPSMGAGAYVDDFKDSDAPQFKGKSKKKKQEMAVAAYLSAKDKKKVAEAVIEKLNEDPETTRAVKDLEPILNKIITAIEKVDKSQDDTEKDVEELDNSIDYLAAAITGKSQIDVSKD